MNSIIKIALFLLTNFLFGNLVLLFVSSNFFLSSLMHHFKGYYHITFSCLLLLISLYLLHLSSQTTRGMEHLLYGFLCALLPVLITTVVLVGISLIPASIRSDQALQGIFFTLKFSALLVFTTGAIYWIPFGVLNSIYMRSNYG